MIHHYYATELPLPNNVNALCRIAGAMTKAEQAAVKSVMSFFDAVDSGLMHTRIEAELDKHDDRVDKNRAIAVVRESKRRAAKRSKEEHETSTNRAPEKHETTTNDAPIPLTINHIKPSVPSGTGVPPTKPVDPVKEEIWREGRRLLTEVSGVPRTDAGGIIGKLVKDYGQIRVLEGIQHCIRHSIADPQTYLLAMQKQNGKQAALERNNDEVLRQFLEQTA